MKKLSTLYYMKLLTIHNVPVPGSNVSESLQAIYNESVLKNVHGDDYIATPWHKDKRKLQYSIIVDGAVPPEISRLVCGGDKMRVTTIQSKCISGDSLELKNRVRLHCLGAELVKIKPTFRLFKKPNEQGVFFSARIEHHAIFPAPLNHIIERFMCAQSEKHMNHYLGLVAVRVRDHDHVT